MSNSNWTWADLTDVQQEQVAKAETTLGADYLLAYQAGQTPASPSAGSPDEGLQVAALTPSQLECLQGLEHHVQAVIVAYKKS